MTSPIKPEASEPARPSGSRPIRLAYLVSHPIQYQAPLLRRIAAEPGIDLTVFYGSDFSVRGYRDEGFGVDVQWDIPLLEGYKHEFLPSIRDKGTSGIFTPISYGLVSRLIGSDGNPRFDALWSHGYATVNQMYGMLAAKALGVPVLLRSDSSLIDRPRGAAKLLAKKAFFAALHHLTDAVLVTGTLNRDYWEHYMGKEFPLFLLPYAVDNDWFQAKATEAATTRNALQAELGIEPARPVILFASKMQTRKHCNDLIEAYARLAPAPGQEPEPYLLLVGDGEERSALERQALATGLKSIRFCGFRNQSELPRFFDLASVFVLPSRHEPWGLIVNEVMNAARPVIVTNDCGCHPDLITDGVEGFVYPVRDVDALEHSLRRMFATPQTAVEMGRRALRRINLWSFEQDISGLKAALQHVTHKVASASSPVEQVRP
jgi:glycosyltransferase involved in cell wall biosynthesis